MYVFQESFKKREELWNDNFLKWTHKKIAESWN